MTRKSVEIDARFREEADRLIADLQECRQRAVDLDLWRSLHSIGAAVDTVGWELAELYSNSVTNG